MIAGADPFGVLPWSSAEFVTDQTIAPTGIASTTALGSHVVSTVIAPSGIASTTALGTPTIAITIAPAGIGSTISRRGPHSPHKPLPIPFLRWYNS
jgi:hypothetical protein